MGSRTLMAKRRRYSDQSLGPTIETLMAETGTTYRGLADKAGLSAGYQPHRPRQPARAFERRHRAHRGLSRRRAGALPRISDPRHHREARAHARADRPPVSPPRVASRTSR